jgi:mannose-6-phosphate isomerase-like protein (cupin superfamily)
MTIPPGGEIGEEVCKTGGRMDEPNTDDASQTHTVDQHLIFTTGTCKAIIAGEEKEVTAGDLVIVPAGTKRE